MSGATLIGVVTLQAAAAAVLLHTGATTLGGTTAVECAAAACAGAGLFYALYGRRGRDGMRALRPPAFAVFAFTLAAAAFGEEVIWRGAAFGYLTRVEGPALAFAGSTLGFAWAHVAGQGWPGFRVHLLTGAVFGGVLLATGHVVDAIAAHAAYNCSLLIAVRTKGESHENALPA